MTQRTTIIVGASAGFGAATAEKLASAGQHVVALARGEARLTTWSSNIAGNVTPVSGDGRDPAVAGALLTEYKPSSVLIGGGATPHMAPLEAHTLETLSLHWNHDVALAFNWLHAILNQPSEQLDHAVVISSGAGLFGSPGSGGYAGAKATTRFLTASAADSARRLGHMTRFSTVNPKLTSATKIGRAAVSGYAEITGADTATALAAPAPYDLDHAGALLATLVSNPDTHTAGHYLLTEDGLAAV